MKKKVLFFSTIKDVRLFKLTGFYVEDIKVLESAGYIVNCTNRFRDFVKFWSYDIAFLYFYKASFIAALLARIFFKKVIYTGGIDELSPLIIINKNKRALYKILFKINYFFSTMCNIVSNEDFINTSKILKQFPRISQSKLSYFPHSIDTKKYENFQLHKKENIIASICWMSTIGNVKRKGIDKTILMFKYIKKNMPEFKLYLIGSLGEGSDFLKDLIRKEELEDSVIFTGSIEEEEKMLILSRSKYYIQLSVYEGFGVAVIESMMLYNHIIHTGVGGLKDTIGSKGYMVKDSNDYAEVLSFISNSKNDYSSNQAALYDNKQFVIENFSRQSRAEYFKNKILNFNV